MKLADIPNICVDNSWFALQVKRDILHRTHYVELLLVVDNDKVTHVRARNHTRFS